MPLTHSITLTDGTNEVTMTWSADEAAIITQGESGDPVKMEISRESIFGISQWAGTALNQLHFEDSDLGGGE